MYRIANRSLEDETYHFIPGDYPTLEEAKRAAERSYVQVRRNGEFIHPEEFVILKIDT
jgi:hypothetical protein